jgi:hypothetical protein
MIVVIAVFAKPAIGNTSEIFSDPEGISYAAHSETTWRTISKYDEMSDKREVSVASEQTNGNGVDAQIVGMCDNGVVVFYATILDRSGRDSVNLTDAAIADDQVPENALFANLQSLIHQTTGAIGYVRGELRVNSDPRSENIFLLSGYINRPVIAQLAPVANSNNALGFGARLDLHTTWRILAKLNTDHGSIVLRIPVYDTAVKSLFVACLDASASRPGRDTGSYLGVAVSPVDHGAVSGAFVAVVTPGAPAADADLRPGDVITEIDSQRISTPADLQTYIKSIEPGQTVRLAYIRNGQLQSAQVMVKKKPQ